MILPRNTLITHISAHYFSQALADFIYLFPSMNIWLTLKLPTYTRYCFIIFSISLHFYRLTNAALRTFKAFIYIFHLHASLRGFLIHIIFALFSALFYFHDARVFAIILFGTSYIFTSLKRQFPQIYYIEYCAFLIRQKPQSEKGQFYYRDDYASQIHSKVIASHTAANV